MRFLIYSKEGAGAGIAFKLKQEDAEVYTYFDSKNAKDMLKGIVPSVSSLADGIKRLDKNQDVIVFDMVGYGKIAETLKVAGYNVLFASNFADRLELDRNHGMTIAKDAGIMVPEYKEFRDSQSALSFLKKNDGKWVIKPNLNKPPSFTAVLDGFKQAQAHINWLKANRLYKESESFILQQFIQGIEVSTEMWFQNGEPIYPVNGTIETKKFLAGDLGPSTGCQTSVVWNYKEKEPRIVGQTLKKLFLLFKAAKYTGPVDINCIVSAENQKAYFLEFTPRIGYNAFYAFCSLLHMPVNEFLMDMAFGNIGNMAIDKESFGYAVRVSIPPYPMGIEDEEDFLEDAELSGDRLIEFYDMEGVYLSDAKKVGEDYFTAGGDGYIMDISAKGQTIREAEDKVKKTFGEIKMLDKQARIVDGTERARRDYGWLDMAGFITSGRGSAATLAPESVGGIPYART